MVDTTVINNLRVDDFTFEEKFEILRSFCIVFVEQKKIPDEFANYMEEHFLELLA